MIFSPLVLILVKQSVNEPWLTKAVIPFHRIVIVQAISWPERSSPKFPTNLMYFRCAAMMSKFNKRLRSNFYFLIHIFVLFSYFKFTSTTDLFMCRRKQIISYFVIILCLFRSFNVYANFHWNSSDRKGNICFGLVISKQRLYKFGCKILLL